MDRQTSILPPDNHNQILLENTHPQSWTNPEPAARYNLVVIGAGTAGLITAAGAAGLGAKVALIERNLLGGDCLNVGCIPSKGIIRSGRVVHEIKNAGEFGANCENEITINFARVMERMRRIRAVLSAHDSAERFSRQLGVDVFFGNGEFIDHDTIGVEGKILRFKKAAICTGARASIPRIPGIAETGYLTNENVFQLTKLPRKIAVIGGGPIGCELAQTFARLGSNVTLLHSHYHILSREDADAAAILQTSFVKDGINLVLGTKILRAEQRDSMKILTVDQNGIKQEIVVEEILVGIGRSPNIEKLGLENAGIAYDVREGVNVNDRLQTSNPRIYAAGDICSFNKFTHAADAMARIVIANALFHGRQKASRLVIPWCTYTDPELAHVGMYEKEATGRSIAVHTITVPFENIDRAVLDGEAAGFARVHLKRGTDTILGATIVGSHAGNIISEISLAMTAGLGLSSIGKTIHPYPTQSEILKKIADAYTRTRLTPFVKRAINTWMKWQRS